MKRNESSWNLWQVPSISKTFALVLSLMAIAGIARAQANFTIDHSIMFEMGRDQDRTQLSAFPSVRQMVAVPFEIAREDLDGDGTKEVILLGCGSEACSIVVLEVRGGTARKILDAHIKRPRAAGRSTFLAVTNEKIGTYRALADFGDGGVILRDRKWGAPQFAYQLVYPMKPPAAAQTAPLPSTPAPSAARAQALPHFTAHHTIQFAPGTDRDRELLNAIPSARGIIEAGSFELAREDLNDDGRKEVILISTSGLCGSAGCSILVLENRGGPATTISSNYLMHKPLAVTNEKVGSYRALASVDFDGAIISTDQRGTPKHQLVLPMDPPTAAQAAPPTGSGSSTPGIASAHANFTVHHTIEFEMGTEQELQQLGAAAVKSYGGWRFLIARADLNDDGTKEVILMDCGTESCGIEVLDIRGGTATRILSAQILHPTVVASFPRLAVTNEKIGSYRALADVNARGAIRRDGEWGEPKFAYQLAYPMEPPSATQTAPLPGTPAAAQTALPPSAPSAAQAASVPSTPAQSACAGLPNCAEVPTFVAVVTDFRVSRGGAYLRDRILTATVRFTNKTDRTLVLGYVQNSGVVLDDQGNRYRVYEETVRGLGTIARDQPDPKFSLAPGERGDARFEFILTPGNVVLGTTYEMDLAVREIDAIAGNQLRLGREHALHLRGFSDAGIDPNASAAPSPPAVSPAPAPVPPVATGTSARPGVDPCGSNPGCFSAGPFMAQVTRVITRLGTNAIGNFAVRLTVKLTNVTDQAIILGCVSGTGSMTDNLGNRYYYDDRNPSAVSGIGLVVGQEADPQFKLNPGESRSAVFELRRTWGQDVPSAYTFDVTLATLEIYPSGQVRVARQYAIGFKDLPVGGPSTPAAVPAAGPCAGKSRCDAAGPFMAEVTHLTRSLGTNSVNNFAVRVTVKLTNISKQPIILGYVTGTGALFDNLGLAYADWAVTGIGTVDKLRADPQFKLDPGKSRSAVFEWRRTYRQEGTPRTYAYDMTIAQLEILPSTQVREIAEYSVGFSGLTAGLMDALKDVVRKSNRR